MNVREDTRVMKQQLNVHILALGVQVMQPKIRKKFDAALLSARVYPG
jgi:hypothetical protein